MFAERQGRHGSTIQQSQKSQRGRQILSADSQEASGYARAQKIWYAKLKMAGLTATIGQ